MFERLQSVILEKHLELFPVIAIYGPRQIGKSTFVQSTYIEKKFGKRKYYTLDDFETLAIAKNEPLALLEQDEPITIDEVQKCPDLLIEIKKIVDKKREPGKFILTGSSDLSFTSNLSKVLTGRVGIIEMLPLSLREVANKKGIPWIINYLNKKEKISDLKIDSKHSSVIENLLLKGGYPPAYLAKNIESAHLWLENYKYNYIEREIKEFANILHTVEFAKLISLCATRTSRLLNQADLARDSALVPMTLSRYLNLLEITFQIKQINPYFTNRSKRFIKTPKIYWWDTGMASFLLNQKSIEDLKINNLWGQLFETFIMIQIYTYIKSFLSGANLYFYRTHSGVEIDGIIEHGLNLFPFEVKASTQVTYEDAKHIREFLAENSSAKSGFVFYLGKNIVELGKNIFGMPVCSLFS